MSNRINVTIKELTGEERTFEQSCNSKGHDFTAPTLEDRAFMELLNSQCARHFGPNSALVPLQVKGHRVEGFVAHRAWGMKNVFLPPTKVLITVEG